MPARQDLKEPRAAATIRIREMLPLLARLLRRPGHMCSRSDDNRIAQPHGCAHVKREGGVNTPEASSHCESVSLNMSDCSCNSSMRAISEL